MPEICILVDNYCDHNNNNIMILLLNRIKGGGFFGTYILHLYIKDNKKNDRDRAFNSLNVLYRKQNIFTFEKLCEKINTSNNIEVVQMFHQNLFDLESFLNDIYDRPDRKTVNVNHVFQVKKSQ